MDATNPIGESVPGIVVPLSGQTITTPMHPNLTVKTVIIKMATNGLDIGVWANWGDQTITITTIGPQGFRAQMAIQFPVQDAGAPPFPCMSQSGGTVNIFDCGMLNGKKILEREWPAVGRGPTIPRNSLGLLLWEY